MCGVRASHQGADFHSHPSASFRPPASRPTYSKLHNSLNSKTICVIVRLVFPLSSPVCFQSPQQLFWMEYYASLSSTFIHWMMAPEGMAAVLLALNQPCYLVCFFALFFTCFVHIFAATVSYGRKELLDIRIAITHLRLHSVFFSTSRTRGIYYKHLTRPRSQSYAGEGIWFPRKISGCNEWLIGLCLPSC
jgi:hypothetical protein